MRSTWRIALPGACALLVGVGIGRFAYSPFIPALVAEGWASPAGAGYLGAGNLAAYVLGAWLAPRLPAGDAALHGAMLLTGVGFIASALDLGFAWLLAWRVLLGVTGGVLMGVAGPRLLTASAPERRGAVTGLVYAGVGLGIVGSGLLVPPLVAASLPAAWIGVGVTALLVTAVGWSGWPQAQATHAGADGLTGVGPAVLRLGAAYTLFGLAQVPHSLFLVDFAARELGLGLAASGPLWVALGVGAVLGPLAVGAIADRTGFRKATVGGYAALALAAALPAVTAGMPALAVSGFIVGACMPGLAGLVGGRLLELAGIGAQRRWWPRIVTGFALGQGVGGYLFTWLASTLGTHRPGFALAGALALAGAALAAAPTRPAQPSRSTA